MNKTAVDYARCLLGYEEYKKLMKDKAFLKSPEPLAT